VPTASQTLARFAAGLRYQDIPPEAIERAKVCIIDTFAACTFGSQFPWSRVVAGYASRYGAGGTSTILGVNPVGVHAPFAALANGVFAHAFEQDSIREPGMGTHSGATLMPAIFALAEESGAGGETMLKAFVAATEVMSRIAVATQHSPEEIGFHSPGLTGPYGAAVAAGIVLGLDEAKLVNALGVAGSLSSGLMAFSKSKQGAMIKRLHLGRASESGVFAACLAADGYEGPESILDGKFGFLEAYCGDHHVEPEALTAGLGKEWETLRISLKRYACHVNAHTPVQSMRELIAEHKFTAADVERVRVEGHERLGKRHNITEPADIMQAQYSVPFCIALAIHRDPDDPRSFDDAALNDAGIRETCRNVEIALLAGASVKSTRVVVKLKDGRELVRERATYKGMPSEPLSRTELRYKFMLLTRDLGEARASLLFERLEHLEQQKKFSLA
jgi:2-methylcitrate dehydratase PrpD